MKQKNLLLSQFTLHSLVHFERAQWWGPEEKHVRAEKEQRFQCHQVRSSSSHNTTKPRQLARAAHLTTDSDVQK